MRPVLTAPSPRGVTPRSAHLTTVRSAADSVKTDLKGWQQLVDVAARERSGYGDEGVAITYYGVGAEACCELRECVASAQIRV